MNNTKSLGTLFNDSVAFTKKHMTVMAVGAVVFGVLMQVIGWGVVGSAIPFVGKDVETWGQQMEEMGERMEELQERVMNGDTSAQAEMETLGREMAARSMQGMGKMGGVFRQMLPALGLAMLVTMLLGLIAKSYFLVVAVKGMMDPAKAFSATISSIVPLVGLWIWLILRSFIWIPFLGIIIAIIVGPRLTLSPLYLLEQKKGVMDSASMSYKKSAGYWGKIVGNMLGVGIPIMICAAIVGKIASSIFGYAIGGVIAGSITQFAGAFMVVFSIQLARTVMEHPKTA